MIKRALAQGIGWIGILVLFAGCATTSRSVNYADHVVAYGVDSHLVEKMAKRLPLELVDIQHLAAKNVPDSLTLGYIKQERTIYQLTSDHVKMLTDAGVSAEVVDYLMTTPATNAIRSYPSFWYPPPPPRPFYGYPGPAFGFGYYCY